MRRAMIATGGLGVRMQRRIAASAVVVLAVIGRWASDGWVARADAPHPAAAGQPVPGTFRPTRGQWDGLGFGEARTIESAPGIVSDGQIAIDEARTTPVLSPFTGRIVRVLVSSGDHVRRGQPLMVVAGQEVVQTVADLRTTIAAAAAARTALVVAERDALRQARLAPTAGAQRDREAAEAALAQARSGQTAAEATLAAARGRAAILELDPRHLPADGTAIVHAPQDGIVISRAAAAGQFVQAATAGASLALLSISDNARVWLQANLRDSDAARVRPGDVIEATVTAVPGRVFRGRIAAVGGAIDPNTRRITARATIDNPGGLLKPGMFAQMRVLTGAAQPRLAVPEGAVVYEGDAAHVWVAHPADRSLEVRAIQAGPGRDGLVTVLAGLKPGERVVTSGAVFIDRAAQPD